MLHLNDGQWLRHFNVGIGTTNPGDTLHINSGSIRINSLTASSDVQTDANKSLTTVSDARKRESNLKLRSKAFAQLKKRIEESVR